MNFTFNPQNFLSNIPYLLKGMVGIFIVILLIIAITAFLNKISNKK